ncbi:hypothetical protein HYQ45_011348 [Verticillium longisporum]|uniref:Uncharacterized protein n=1 Tax=Verticillium longisporum TaxID=100787 RepID=A0A8I2ZGU2_VERLO|nr:hypothetical protein HYQ45_011348 [Verticillium longisporum]
MASADSFIIHDDKSASTDNDELDSLPSISSSVIDSEADSEAQAEKFAFWSWGRYMEWMHNVEIRWTNKAKFKAVGVAEAAATL